MSVLIRGVEMPSNCGECLNIGWNYVFECDLDDVESGERRLDCPLVPVPDHGRLIDADVFEKQNAYFWNRDFINPKYCDTLADLVNAAPTIIPAESEGE